MAVGELVVSLFADKIMMELFKTKGKKNYLVKKHFEKYNVSFSDFSKIDVLELEKMITDFVSKTSIKSGKLYINVFAEEDLMDFREVDLDTTNKKDILKMLPFEIETLGEKFETMKYNSEIIGSKVKLYFLNRNIVTSLSEINIGRSWDLLSVTPGYLVYQGLIQGDGILVDVEDDAYTVYGFKGGYAVSTEKFNTYGSYGDEDEITPNKLFDSIKDELVQYVRNFNFKELIDVDSVSVVFNGNYKESFVSEEFDSILFETPRDLRDWLDVNSDPNEFDSVKNYKPNCKNFRYSSVALGTFYNKKEISKVSFSKERMSFMCKNLLLTSLTFTLVLCAALPSVSILANNRLGDIQENVNSLSTSVASYETTIGTINEEVKSKDSLINDYNSYVSSLGGLTDSNRNFISSVLGYLPANTPTTIVVDTIALEKGSKMLVISGVSKNYKDIGSFAIELEEFGSVSINNIADKELLNTSGYPFEIQLRSK